MTADPLRGDPECPEVQSVHWCARLLYSEPEPEPEEWADVISPDELETVRRGRIAVGVLTVCTTLAVTAQVLTALFLVIMLTRRGA